MATRLMYLHKLFLQTRSLEATTIALNTYDAVLDRYTAQPISDCRWSLCLSYYALVQGGLADEGCVYHGDR